MKEQVSYTRILAFLLKEKKSFIIIVYEGAFLFMKEKALYSMKRQALYD